MPVRNDHGPVAPARTEPSWGRVLVTTVTLWAQRRLTARRRQLAAATVTMTAALVVVAVAALQLTGTFTATALSATRPLAASVSRSQPVPAPQAQAAAWVAGQVSGAAMIGCHPAMCAMLQARGVAAGQLVPLRTGSAGPVGVNVVVISASTDGRVIDRYAPALIASFGSGVHRIEVRAVQSGGEAAYQAALRSDLAARQAAGSELLRNRNLQVTARGAAQLRAGQVDSRLLATLAALAARYRVRVIAFSDAAPGAAQPFRQVTIGSDLAGALAMVRVQVPPYLPARAAIADGTLSVEFAAPSPLGLLTPVLTVSPRYINQTQYINQTRGE